MNSFEEGLPTLKYLISNLSDFIFCHHLDQQQTPGYIHYLAVNEKENFVPRWFNNMNDKPPLPELSGKPGETLHKLLAENNFLEPMNRNPLIHQKKRGNHKFNMDQKRSLAARLVLSLAHFLDSDYYILKSWDPSEIFFLMENGKCEREIVYVSPVSHQEHNLEDENFGREVYTRLATLLLEIEFGPSTNLEPNPTALYERVGSALEDLRELKESRTGTNFNINLKIKRETYLEAVKCLLHPMKTCSKLNIKGYNAITIAWYIFIHVAEEISKTVKPSVPDSDFESSVANIHQTIASNGADYQSHCSGRGQGQQISTRSGAMNNYYEAASMSFGMIFISTLNLPTIKKLTVLALKFHLIKTKLREA